MNIVLAGGSGFLGRALSRRLLADGHGVTVLTRQPGGERPRGSSQPRQVAWNPDGSSGSWAETLSGADAVINLSGAGIADKRWNAERKALLRSSRVLSTRSLVSAIEVSPRRPTVFIQGTAMGYYGASLDDRPLDESAPAGSDFLGQLCVEWEAETKRLPALGCRLAIVRTGLVLSAAGGALPQIALPFRLFGGGLMASGRQVLSWIHIDDWTAIVTWILTNPSVSGVFNATAPNPATSAEFARVLGRVLHRPSWFPVPAFVLRLVVGEMADAGLIQGQSVVPVRALAMGFTFRHPNLDEALRHALAAR